MEYLTSLDKQTAFIIILLIVGVVMLILNIRSLFLSRYSEEWRQTDGKIIRSELFSKRGTSNSGVSYKPDIEYSYYVDGQMFNSKRIYFGSDIMSSSNKSRSIRYVKKYPVDATVTVYYNPMKLKMSVLEGGIHSEPIVGMTLGLLFCAIAIYLIGHPGFII